MSEDGARPTASDAAALVRSERERAAAKSPKEPQMPAAPEKEVVSAAGWVGAEAGDVDDNEIERRQRAIAQKLVQRQRQLARDGEELERVRRELKELEAPLKAEILSIRVALEGTATQEKALVDEINTMRSGKGICCWRIASKNSIRPAKCRSSSRTDGQCV